MKCDLCKGRAISHFWRLAGWKKKDKDWPRSTCVWGGGVEGRRMDCPKSWNFFGCTPLPMPSNEYEMQHLSVVLGVDWSTRMKIISRSLTWRKRLKLTCKMLKSVVCKCCCRHIWKQNQLRISIRGEWTRYSEKLTTKPTSTLHNITSQGFKAPSEMAWVCSGRLWLSLGWGRWLLRLWVGKGEIKCPYSWDRISRTRRFSLFSTSSMI